MIDCKHKKHLKSIGIHGCKRNMFLDNNRKKITRESKAFFVLDNCSDYNTSSFVFSIMVSIYFSISLGTWKSHDIKNVIDYEPLIYLFTSKNDSIKSLEKINYYTNTYNEQERTLYYHKIANVGEVEVDNYLEIEFMNDHIIEKLTKTSKLITNIQNPMFFYNPLKIRSKEDENSYHIYNVCKEIALEITHKIQKNSELL